MRKTSWIFSFNHDALEKGNERLILINLDPKILFSILRFNNKMGNDGVFSKMPDPLYLCLLGYSELFAAGLFANVFHSKTLNFSSNPGEN